MATTDLLPNLPLLSTPPGNNANSSSGAFSPLTLFECTIQNASMLVESMVDRDLMAAMKIVLNLHSHVVDIMDPRMENLVERSDNLKEMEASGMFVKPQMTTEPKRESSLSSFPPAVPTADETSNNSILGAALDGIKHEQDIEEWEDDDCVITDDLGMMGNDDSTDFNNSYQRPSKIARRSGVLGMGVGTPPGTTPAGEIPEIPSECKTIMRRAYKALKGSGPHLFDFSLPFNSPVNQRVADQVMAKAQEMAKGKGWSDDVWSTEKYWPYKSRIVRIFITFRHDAKLRMKTLKLARRQRSFELVATHLNTEDLEKFRIILQRDYTSSDEECGTGGEEGQLRVRELGWQSSELKKLKKQLDDVFLESCATQKQKIQLEKVMRDGKVRSQRPPPDGAPVWALQQSAAAAVEDTDSTME